MLESSLGFAQGPDGTWARGDVGDGLCGLSGQCTCVRGDEKVGGQR